MKIHFIGIDDANLIFDASFERRPDRGLPEISHLVSMARHAKIYFWVCTQIPHQLGASIHSNAFTKIMFSLSNGKDIDYMIHSMGITDKAQRECSHRLSAREVIIKFSSRYTEPFLARIPELMIARDIIKDEEIYRNNKRILNQFRQETQQETYHTSQAIALPYLSEPEPKPQKTAFKTSLQEKEMLMYIYLKPWIGVSERYKELGLSLGSGSRTVEKLIREQVVIPWDIRTKSKGGVTRFLEITQKGLKSLNLPKKPLGRGSEFLHFCYQNLIAIHLKTLPEIKKILIEGKIGNKCADVLVKAQNEKTQVDVMIAIEVAMDSVTERNNIVKDLQTGCSSVVIVAKNPKVKEKIKQILENLNPKIKDRVTVILLSQALMCKNLQELLPGGEL